VARYAEVHAVLNDPLTFCSSRGVGLSDFAKENPWRPASLILEADPPAHTSELQDLPLHNPPISVAPARPTMKNIAPARCRAAAVSSRA
jgi:cytochrome P450